MEQWPFKSSHIPSVGRPGKGPRFISGTSLKQAYLFLIIHTYSSQPGTAAGCLSKARLWTSTGLEGGEQEGGLHSPNCSESLCLAHVITARAEGLLCISLDLKDAFFPVPLLKSSQPVFTFRGAEPELGISGQLAWTTLPQGFRNSTIFNKAPDQDVRLLVLNIPR